MFGTASSGVLVMTVQVDHNSNVAGVTGVNLKRHAAASDAVTVAVRLMPHDMTHTQGCDVVRHVFPLSLSPRGVCQGLVSLLVAVFASFQEPLFTQ
jgi:hypothetical protein